MEITFTRGFIRNFEKLPRNVQVKADRLVGLLQIDFRDSRLHTKKLRTEVDYYSCRVGRDYRIIFVFESGEVIKLLDIRHRKDIYKKR